ncbi:MAG: lysoplasmalogenase [Cyclobacteriaceae bacterium]
MKAKFLIAFFVVSMCELLAVILNLEVLQWAAKPLIMITLGSYFYFSIRRDEMGSSKPVLGAIVFSLGGDIALMFQQHGQTYFMLGLASFLVAHLLYILAYRHHKNESNGKELHGIQKFRFALPIVLTGTGLITILYSHLGDLRIPVVVYAIVLIVMVLQAMFRWGHTSAESFWLVLLGAILFMLSDSLIAINKFLHQIELASLLIMGTYILAQYLIITGLIKHTKKAN